MAVAGFAKLFTANFVTDIYSADFPEGADVARSQVENALAAADAKGDAKAKVAALLRSADFHLRCKDANKVEADLDEAGKLCRRLKFDEGKAYMLLMQAKLELWYGSADEAVSWSRDAMKIFKKLEKDWAIAFACNMHAYVLSCAGKPKEGMQCAREALEIYRAVEDQALEVSVLRLLMDLFINAGDFLRAGLVGWEIVAVVGASGGEKKHKIKLADVIQKIASIEFEGNDLDKAMAAAEDACARFQQAGDVPGEAAVMTTMMNVYLKKGKFYEGVDVARAIVELYRERGGEYLKEVGGALLDLAQVYENGDCYEEAMDAANQAMGYATHLQDPEMGGAASQKLHKYSIEQKKENMKLIIEKNRSRLGNMPTNLIIAPEGLDIDAINGFAQKAAAPKKKGK